MSEAPTTLRAVHAAWPSLGAPPLASAVGVFRASFVGRPLQVVAPPGLGLIGLPRWFGKEFTRGDDAERLDGINLLGNDGTQRVLPMTAATGPALADGRPALVVTYPRDARPPWRWVRDELRAWDDDLLVGMTYVEPALRRTLGRLPGTPFLLTRVRD